MSTLTLYETNNLNGAEYVIFSQYRNNPCPPSITMGKLYTVYYNKDWEEHYILNDEGIYSVSGFIVCQNKYFNYN